MYSCARQRNLVHSGCLLRPALCGIKWSKDVPLFHPSQSPPTQATKDSVHWQPYREMDLDGVHQEVTQAAESVISRCRVCQYYHLFPAGIAFLWGTPQISCLLSIDCYYLSRLINYNNRIKVSMCIHHTSVGAVAYIKFVHMYIFSSLSYQEISPHFAALVRKLILNKNSEKHLNRIFTKLPTAIS